MDSLSSNKSTEIVNNFIFYHGSKFISLSNLLFEEELDVILASDKTQSAPMIQDDCQVSLPPHTNNDVPMRSNAQQIALESIKEKEEKYRSSKKVPLDHNDPPPDFMDTSFEGAPNKHIVPYVPEEALIAGDDS